VVFAPHKQAVHTGASDQYEDFIKNPLPAGCRPHRGDERTLFAILAGMGAELAFAMVSDVVAAHHISEARHLRGKLVFKIR
jgi:hypothetical protein